MQTTPNYFYDTNHVRYELVSSREGKPYNWLFLPGGPGADSRYFHSLLKIIELPGNVWFIDLPGNGDNTAGVPDDYDYDNWFTIFPETVKKFSNPVIVGQSFGGMFPLAFPELEDVLKGFVIISSAPCLWLEEAVNYSKQFELPDLTEEMREFTRNPNETTFKIALDACMPYYFPKRTLEIGRKLLLDLPFSLQPACWWQRKAVEMNFSASWIPQNVPTMIIGAPFDCITPFTLFKKDLRFQRTNIEMITIEEAGHIPWIEDPEAVKAAFDNFCKRLASESVLSLE